MKIWFLLDCCFNFSFFRSLSFSELKNTLPFSSYDVKADENEVYNAENYVKVAKKIYTAENNLKSVENYTKILKIIQCSLLKMNTVKVNNRFK